MIHEQEAQLLHRGHMMLTVIEYFANSLRMTPTACVCPY